ERSQYCRDSTGWEGLNRRHYVVLTLVALLAGCSSRSQQAAWQVANGDLGSTRATDATALDATTAPHLHVLWRLRLPRDAGAFGAITANPVLAGGTVYVQDSASTVYALS